MATLTQLVTRAQEESDNVGSEFVSTTAGGEWTHYINAAYSELYGLVIRAYGTDYYVQTPFSGYTFTTDGINQGFALPTDFFKLLGVDVLYGNANQWVSLKPFAMGDRNKFSAINSPTPAAGQTVRLFYIPKLTALAVGTDATIDLQNDWEEYIVVDAAMRAVAKEESDVSVLMARKQALIARINDEAENRDAGMPAGIVGSRGRQSPGMMYRLNGAKLWLIGFQVSWGAGYWGEDELGSRWW